MDLDNKPEVIDPARARRLVATYMEAYFEEEEAKAAVSRAQEKAGKAWSRKFDAHKALERVPAGIYTFDKWGVQITNQSSYPVPVPIRSRAY